MARKATINMVAERAGVSRGTVDRVLNQRPHVKPDIYERVLRAMRELRYIPPREEQAKALGLILPPDMPKCTLGILLPNEEGYFRRELMHGIASASNLLSDYGVEILVDKCETDLPDETVERLICFQERNVNGIALCAKDHYSVVDCINDLSDHGIPIVTFSSDLTNSRRICFVGQKLVNGGRVAGELMSKYLNPDDTLLIAIGNPEFSAHRLRLQGFCERIYEKGFSGGKLEIIETYNDYSLTYQKIRDVLERKVDVKGIYMANHSVTGCIDAIRDMGLQGKIHIISHDLTDSTKRLLKTGEVDFAIAQNIRHQSYRALIILQEYIQKNIKPSQEKECPPIEIVCSENIEE